MLPGSNNESPNTNKGTCFCPASAARALLEHWVTRSEVHRIKAMESSELGVEDMATRTLVFPSFVGVLVELL